jgi:hypothetical protein
MRRVTMAPTRLAGRGLVTGVASLLATLALAATADAGTLTITNADDGGPGSLRDAIGQARSGDTIVFAVSGTIVLTGGEIAISKDLDIEGPGAALLSISGNNRSRIFDIFVGGTTASPRSSPSRVSRSPRAGPAGRGAGRS